MVLLMHELTVVVAAAACSDVEKKTLKPDDVSWVFVIVVAGMPHTGDSCDGIADAHHFLEDTVMVMMITTTTTLAVPCLICFGSSGASRILSATCWSLW